MFLNLLKPDTQSAKAVIDIDAEIAKATEMINQYPGYFKAFNARGIFYCEKGEFEAAITDFTQAIILDTSHADIYYSNRGLAYTLKEAYSEAISDFSKAIEINPDDADSYLNRGNVRVFKGEYEGAKVDYRRANEIDASHKNARENLDWLLIKYFGASASSSELDETQISNNNPPHPIGLHRYSARCYWQ